MKTSFLTREQAVEILSGPGLQYLAESLKRADAANKASRESADTDYDYIARNAILWLSEYRAISAEIGSWKDEDSKSTHKIIARLDPMRDGYCVEYFVSGEFNLADEALVERFEIAGEAPLYFKDAESANAYFLAHGIDAEIECDFNPPMLIQIAKKYGWRMFSTNREGRRYFNATVEIRREWEAL